MTFGISKNTHRFIATLILFTLFIPVLVQNAEAGVLWCTDMTVKCKCAKEDDTRILKQVGTMKVDSKKASKSIFDTRCMPTIGWRETARECAKSYCSECKNLFGLGAANCNTRSDLMKIYYHHTWFDVYVVDEYGHKTWGGSCKLCK